MTTFIEQHEAKIRENEKEKVKKEYDEKLEKMEKERKSTIEYLNKEQGKSPKEINKITKIPLKAIMSILTNMD